MGMDWKGWKQAVPRDPGVILVFRWSKCNQKLEECHDLWQGATDRDRSRLLVPCREVVSRNRNERSGCSRVDTGNWARTGRDRAPGRASTRQSWQGATDRDRSRLLVPCREVVSRNRNERSGCSRVDTGNWARTGRDRSRPVRKSVVWTRP